jgi:hypothetical protein
VALQPHVHDETDLPICPAQPGKYGFIDNHNGIIQVAPFNQIMFEQKFQLM